MDLKFEPVFGPSMLKLTAMFCAPSTRACKRWGANSVAIVNMNNRTTLGAREQHYCNVGFSFEQYDVFCFNLVFLCVPLWRFGAAVLRVSSHRQCSFPTLEAATGKGTRAGVPAHTDDCVETGRAL